MLDALNPDRIFQKHSWLLTRDLAIVTSPDFDGLLCALLGAAHLDWRLVGFYDGQTLALATPIAHIQELVFLDVEIYRPAVRSLGNHLLQWDKHLPTLGFAQTLNPNLLRSITCREFDRKYPFGTFHFMLALLLAGRISISLPTVTSHLVSIFLYPDGTHQNTLKYRTNAQDWVAWLGVKTQATAAAFFHQLTGVPLADLVHALGWLDQELQSIGFAKKDDPCRFNPTQAVDYARASRLWAFLQRHTGWTSAPLPAPSVVIKLDNRSTKLTRTNYLNVLAQNPLSLALTSRSHAQGLQYTLVPPTWRWLTD